MIPSPISTGRSTFGEALITLGGLAGFLILIWQEKIQSVSDIWFYAQIMLPVIALYAALLLVRAIFTFMAGNDTFWWEKYEEEHHAKKK